MWATIREIQTSETPAVSDGILGVVYKVKVILSCGHDAEPNPIYTYRVGAKYRCFQCDRNQGFQA